MKLENVVREREREQEKCRLLMCPLARDSCCTRIGRGQKNGEKKRDLKTHNLSRYRRGLIHSRRPIFFVFSPFFSCPYGLQPLVRKVLVPKCLRSLALFSGLRGEHIGHAPKTQRKIYIYIFWKREGKNILKYIWYI